MICRWIARAESGTGSGGRLLPGRSASRFTPAGGFGLSMESLSPESEEKVAVVAGNGKLHAGIILNIVRLRGILVPDETVFECKVKRAEVFEIAVSGQGQEDGCFHVGAL